MLFKIKKMFICKLLQSVISGLEFQISDHSDLNVCDVWLAPWQANDTDV